MFADFYLCVSDAADKRYSLGNTWIRARNETLQPRSTAFLQSSWHRTAMSEASQPFGHVLVNMSLSSSTCTFTALRRHFGFIAEYEF